MNHRALQLANDRKTIFTAMSKKLFYFRMHISQFVLQKNCVPINPFMQFEYFLLDTIDRDMVREANNTMLQKADECWVFGDIADGVLAEIIQAKKQQKTIRYFRVNKSKHIEEIPKNCAVFEQDVQAVNL